eukprot:TRINITY_DN5393_c0_g1_i4.p1 TRINITY_DN5393_c0_g1~~TRINITY_DN5393_c0_g1_i4.p1  ORF type:complete len:159 (+),score=47.68 TRINITY_DN5393_c0_g1_i4:97-573(+)
MNYCFFFFFFQAEDGIRDAQESRGLGDVYKRQVLVPDTSATGLNLLQLSQEISIRQGKRAVEALRRGVKVASECEANFENVPLYVELLNVYLHHFGVHNDQIEVKWINALISLLQDNVAALQQADPEAPSIAHYARTRQYIQQMMAEDARYSDIDLNP